MSLTLNDINEIRRGIEIERCNINNLEALLVHPDDVYSLIQEIRDKDMSGLISSSFTDKMTIMGIKIIKSHHIQPGSVFKIWKTDKPTLYPEFSDQQYAHFDPQLPPFKMAGPLLPFIKIPEFSKDTIAKSLPPVVEKKKKKKHSTTRKIELGPDQKRDKK